MDGLRSSEFHCNSGHCFASVLCRSSEEKWGDEVSFSLVADDNNSFMSNLTTMMLIFLFLFKRVTAAGPAV